MSASNPFDAQARRACLNHAVKKFYTRLRRLAYKIDADLEKRGFGRLSSHSKIADAYRFFRSVVHEALAFEKRAEDFQRQRLHDTGKFDVTAAWNEEYGRQLWERLRQELEQLRERLYSHAKRLFLPRRGGNRRPEGLCETTAEELSYRVNRAFAEGQARMHLAAQDSPTAKLEEAEGADSALDQAAGNAGSPPANLAELIAPFQSAAWLYHDLAFRNGRHLPDLQNEPDTFAAMNRLVEIGKALAAELERAGKDSTELHKLLDAAFMGLGRDRYVPAWESVRVRLAQIATVLSTLPPTTKPSKGEGTERTVRPLNAAPLIPPLTQIPTPRGPAGATPEIERVRARRIHRIAKDIRAVPSLGECDDRAGFLVDKLIEAWRACGLFDDPEAYVFLRGLLADPNQVPPRALWGSLRSDAEGDWYTENTRLAVWHAIACLFLRQDDYPNTPMMRSAFWSRACCVIADRLDAEAERIEKTIIARPNGGESDGGVGTAPAVATNNAAGDAFDKRFRVALSFPGEHRPFVAQVADVLASKLDRRRVFYDKYYEAELARPNLDTYLQRIYHDESDLIAVFLCAEYEKKDWCGLEWRAIRDLIKRRECAAIMPFRFDSTTIPGLFSIDGYVEIRERPAAEVAALILERLKHNDNPDCGSR